MSIFFLFILFKIHVLQFNRSSLCVILLALLLPSSFLLGFTLNKASKCSEQTLCHLEALQLDAGSKLRKTVNNQKEVNIA